MKSAADNRSADLVMTGGVVHTMNAAGHLASGIAIKDGRIVRVGTPLQVQAMVGPGTRVVRLRGRSVLPGINDSHLHGAWLGLRWPDLLLDRLTGTADLVPDSRLGKQEERRAAILRAGDLLASLGITSYTEPGLGPCEHDGGGRFGVEVLREYAGMAARGELKARVSALLLFAEVDGRSSLPDLVAGLRDLTPPAEVPGWFKVTGVKIFADGIPPMRTAWSDEPYEDGTHGAPLVEGDSEDERETALTTMIETAAAAGHQVAVHATGSRATRTVTRALAGAPGRRHYLVHGDVLHPDTLKTMAAAGIGLTTQPGIAAAASPMLRDALGQAALGHAWPVRDALAAGVRLSLSSDAPMLTPDWRHGVAAAATRWAVEGARDQRLALDQALRAYTSTPAWQEGAESWKGSLEPGKVADLCVLDDSLLDAHPADLPEVPVAMTMVDGRIVYER
ncbi:amidohydrolase [Nonomuraea sp. NPDC001831]|uniref:amidohydrolase n=1 Tax=Nonomuraea sp. NPDC001831 TaxID=3364340 RepID=UPI0036BF4BB6